MFDKIKHFVIANKRPIIFYSGIAFGTAISLTIADALGSAISRNEFEGIIAGVEEALETTDQDTTESN